MGILLSKIKSLDDQSLSVVKTAAAFGSDFQLDNLALVSGLGEAETHKLLWPLIQDGTILPLSNDYKFLPEFYEEIHKNLIKITLYD